MLQNAYFLAKIGADTAESEQHFAEILPKTSTDDACEVQVADGALVGVAVAGLRGEEGAGDLLRRPGAAARGWPRQSRFSTWVMP